MPVGGEPIGIVEAFGSVWVVNSEFDSGGTPSVSRIDPASASVEATVPVGAVPLEVAAAFGAVWVSNSEDDTVSRIDPATNEVVATIDVCERAGGDGGRRRRTLGGLRGERRGRPYRSALRTARGGRSRWVWSPGSWPWRSTACGSRTTSIPRSRGSTRRRARWWRRSTRSSGRRSWRRRRAASGSPRSTATPSSGSIRRPTSPTRRSPPRRCRTGSWSTTASLWVATDLGPILQRLDPATGEITGTWVVSDQGAINANQLFVEAGGAFWFPLLDGGEVVKVTIPS